VISPEVQGITLAKARLRLALRCLVAAAHADPELYKDPSWQFAMTEISAILNLSPDVTKLREELRKAA
jgi:hypothetical protein